ncbi:COP9 signalosome complex subunit 7b-like [Polymixia lowei]
MAGEQKHGSQLTKQFVLLSRGAKGLDLDTLIKQLLEAPGLYAFAEVLELPCIKELSKGSTSGYSQMLKIFAYGTYRNYKAFKDTLPPLSDIQRTKLRHLSIVNLAANMQVIPYSVLLTDLELASVRQLEDLLIEALYADVIQGKLDHCKQQLEVDSCISRDIPLEGTTSLTNALTQWCGHCEAVLTAIEQQVDRVNIYKEAHLKTLQQTEAEVRNIRQQMVTSSPSSQNLDSLMGLGEEGAVASPRGLSTRCLSSN